MLNKAKQITTITGNIEQPLCFRTLQKQSREENIMTKGRQFNSVTTLATSASILPEALYPDPAHSTRPSPTTTAHITQGGSLSSLILYSITEVNFSERRKK